MSKSVIARVPDKLARDIEFFAKREQLDKSSIVRRLLGYAIQRKKLHYALDEFKNRKISLAKAAEIAELPFTDMMEQIAKENIPIHYTSKDLRDDFEAVFGKK